MFIRDVRAMSLGVTEKEAGENTNGEKYNGYTCLNYVVSGEKTSRKFYADSTTLKSSVRKLDEWGKFFPYQAVLMIKAK